MNIRDYWLQSAEAYQAFKHQEATRKLDAELDAILKKLSSVSCKCEKVDAHYCYADKHDTMEIDDLHSCRCRCHRTDEF